MMSINRNYAVLGLGRYGRSVAQALVAGGADVLAVDLDIGKVNAAIAELPYCKCADVTDPEVIRQLGISEMDVVVIAMASDLEASVLSTMLCKEAGVETVIVKCANEMHERILLRVGADRAVIPERDSGTRLAKNLLSSGFVDLIELSGDVSMVELDVKPEWVGRSLIELDLRRKYDVNVVAIRKDGGIRVSIDPNAPLEAAEELIVIANTAKLGRLK